MIQIIQIDAGMVIIASVVNMGLGMFWYSPSVFGKQWMKAVGLTTRLKHRDMSFAYAMSFFASLLTAFTLELFLVNLPGSTAITGVMVGFWAGIGFVATYGLSQYLFNPQAKSKEAHFINIGYYVVSFMIMGLLLGF